MAWCVCFTREPIVSGGLDLAFSVGLSFEVCPSVSSFSYQLKGNRYVVIFFGKRSSFSTLAFYARSCNTEQALSSQNVCMTSPSMLRCHISAVSCAGRALCVTIFKMAALCALLGWRIFHTSLYILLMNARFFILETEPCEMARSLLYKFYKGTPRNFT